MPTNKKPVLSVLVDGEKRDQFSRLCSSQGRPMAWAINSFIDQCLENDSINCRTAPPSAFDGKELAELKAAVMEIAENLIQIGVYKPLEAVEEGREINQLEKLSKPSLVAEETPEQQKIRAEVRKIRKLNTPPSMEKQIAEALASVGLEDD